ncbi:MAG: ATP-dependent metallopeptidase FtsH/Yme1/Tma family protein, partial [Chloroflexi bacterium]|nr:ATP-dependent metallopeptidase FtsH/Yme1/Tma family protein [Chloroflexota bacterium]
MWLRGRFIVNTARPRNNLVYLLIIVAIGAIIFTALRGNTTQSEDVPLSEVAALINAGKAKEVVVSGDDVKVDTGGEPVTSRKDPSTDLAAQLKDLGVDAVKLQAVKYVVDRPPEWGTLLSTLSFILPALIVGGLIYFMFRQAQGTNNQAMSFGKSRARMFTGEHPTVTFEDVAGAEEAKHDLQEVVEFLKEPEKFVSLGARIPKGVLLVGSPGTGKTLLAKAVSGEAGVPFFSISGSEFVEMFVGVGASRVRDLFDQAKRHSPCIVFVDEIDAVGRHRGAGLGGSHDEREQTLNQILVEMDGFDTDTNVIVVAATNRPDILDPALLRPGRFDRRVVLDRPDMKGREEIFKVHVRGKPLSDDVNLGNLAKSTPGFVGADIENMVNEAAIVAARRNKKIIAMTDFEEAMERVMLGPERKSRVIHPKEKKITAFHEAGHAVVMRALPNSDPLRKVTIIPRGFAAGLTWSMPEDDNSHMTRSKLKDMLAGILGGRAAEETVFEEITTGASNDLEKVTEIARSMVQRWGMSEKLGPLVYGKKEELVFLGKELGEQRDYSEAVAQQIDGEVQRIVAEAHETALRILSENRDRLDRVAAALIEIESLDWEDFEKVWNGEELPKADSPSGTPSAPPKPGKSVPESPTPTG